MPAKISSATPARRWGALLFITGLLVLILAVLFYRSFLSQAVVFSNDGPLGGLVADQNHLPQTFSGLWSDLNSIGSNCGASAPSLSSLLRLVVGPVGYAKFFAPIALLILGLGAWTFFRALKLSGLAAILGALAAMLNSTCFAGACWGVASVEIALGMNFFALALIAANHRDTPWLTRWTRLALAGMCVGMNVMEGADVGALCSVLVALFAFYKSVTESEGSFLAKSLSGCSRVTVIALFAAFLAFQTVVSLVSTQIQGVVGTGQDTETKAQHWDYCTQWSIPKTETLGLIVPGLFGYKMDTPKDMMPQFAQFYENGVYWGGMGRDPALDRWLDGGSIGTPPPSGFMRFTGGGNYLGILVLLFAAWAGAQAFRKENSPYTPGQRKLIFFWLAVLAASLLFAWGRFAPFYAVLYQLPYFSTIRNPCKFVIFLTWAAVVLFAYGIHALSLRQSKPPASRFDRRWAYACGMAFAASALGWLIFSSQKAALVQYLQQRGYPDETQAGNIAAFAISQAGWFVPLLGAGLVLALLATSGYFSGNRARLGAVLLGGFLLFDLGRANLPYLVHWDYLQKYEVGTLNPVVQKLTENPNEHRVAGLPFRSPPGFELFDQLYRIEWMQHHFPYYNIQCLDIVQMPRMPENLKAYLETFAPRGTAESVPLIARHWMLTNTRYLLGPAGYLEVLNQQLDPALKRFRIVDRFDVVPKPGILRPDRLEELTAVLNDNGPYALFEFTGVLPRVKLYGNWLVNSNDQANLKTLADLSFDPAKTVLVSTPQKGLPPISTNENSGAVEFKSYSPKHIVLGANATSASILLLNDKFDLNWHVTVDGKPAELLRCNYLMRGVYLDPGAHTVAFSFSVPNRPLYITLAALVAGMILIALLFILTRRHTGSAAKN
jgi:hypothetical protein